MLEALPNCWWCRQCTQITWSWTKVENFATFEKIVLAIFSKTVRSQKDHIEPKDIPESKLQIQFLCSNEIFSILELISKTSFLVNHILNNRKMLNPALNQNRILWVLLEFVCLYMSKSTFFIWAFKISKPLHRWGDGNQQNLHPVWSYQLLYSQRPDIHRLYSSRLGKK